MSLISLHQRWWRWKDPWWAWAIGTREQRRWHGQGWRYAGYTAWGWQHGSRWCWRQSAYRHRWPREACGARNYGRGNVAWDLAKHRWWHVAGNLGHHGRRLRQWCWVCSTGDHHLHDLRCQRRALFCHCNDFRRCLLPYRRHWKVHGCPVPSKRLHLWYMHQLLHCLVGWHLYDLVNRVHFWKVHLFEHWHIDDLLNGLNDRHGDGLLNY
mmetsp:Transcript_45627/g.102410  ORF Transcript_45627/g.102410 Transcript_45627/m.102410 type:complete len:210 (+) Transcript_45627:136-765(+)